MFQGNLMTVATSLVIQNGTTVEYLNDPVF